VRKLQGLAARPDQLSASRPADRRRGRTGRRQQWFNTVGVRLPGQHTAGACGTAPAAGFGFYGDAQNRHHSRAQGSKIFNMALFKDFPLTEEGFLWKFRAEAFQHVQTTPIREIEYDPGATRTMTKVTSAADPAHSGAGVAGEVLEAFSLKIYS